jgi:transcriptional regulator with XRE-family HTH domain
MNASNKLLDKYAEVCKYASDKAIANALRVRQSAVSNWRHERAHPNAEAIERMCRAIGEPLRSWLPLIEAERARTPADKQVWLRLAQAAAAIAMIYLYGRLDVHNIALAGVAFASRNPGTLYIMSNHGKCLHGLAKLCVWILVFNESSRRSRTSTTQMINTHHRHSRWLGRSATPAYMSASCQPSQSAQSTNLHSVRRRPTAAKHSSANRACEP